MQNRPGVLSLFTCRGCKSFYVPQITEQISAIYTTPIIRIMANLFTDKNLPQLVTIFLIRFSTKSSNFGKANN